MKLEVYKPDEIINVIHLLETVQDGLEIETSDILWDMLQEAIEILYYEEDDE